MTARRLSDGVDDLLRAVATSSTSGSDSDRLDGAGRATTAPRRASLASASSPQPDGNDGAIAQRTAGRSAVTRGGSSTMFATIHSSEDEDDAERPTAVSNKPRSFATRQGVGSDVVAPPQGTRGTGRAVHAVSASRRQELETLRLDDSDEDDQENHRADVQTTSTTQSSNVKVGLPMRRPPYMTTDDVAATTKLSGEALVSVIEAANARRHQGTIRVVPDCSEGGGGEAARGSNSATSPCRRPAESSPPPLASDSAATTTSLSSTSLTPRQDGAPPEEEVLMVLTSTTAISPSPRARGGGEVEPPHDRDCSSLSFRDEDSSLLNVSGIPAGVGDDTLPRASRGARRRSGVRGHSSSRQSPSAASIHFEYVGSEGHLPGAVSHHSAHRSSDDASLLFMTASPPTSPPQAARAAPSATERRRRNDTLPLQQLSRERPKPQPVQLPVSHSIGTLHNDQQPVHHQPPPPQQQRPTPRPSTTSGAVSSLQNMYQRAVRRRAQQEAEREQQRAASAHAAMKGCTFVPHITAKGTRAKATTALSSRSPSTTANNNETPIENVSVQRQRLLHDARGAERDAGLAECTFAPKIEPISAALVQRARDLQSSQPHLLLLPTAERLHLDSRRRAIEWEYNAELSLQALRGSRPQAKRTPAQIDEHIKTLEQFQQRRDATIRNLMEVENQRYRRSASAGRVSSSATAASHDTDGETLVDPDAVVHRILHRPQRTKSCHTAEGGSSNTPHVNVVSRELAARRRAVTLSEWFAELSGSLLMKQRGVDIAELDLFSLFSIASSFGGGGEDGTTSWCNGEGSGGLVVNATENRVASMPKQFKRRLEQLRQTEEFGGIVSALKDFMRARSASTPPDPKKGSSSTPQQDDGDLSQSWWLTYAQFCAILNRAELRSGPQRWSHCGPKDALARHLKEHPHPQATTRRVSGETGTGGGGEPLPFARLYRQQTCATWLKHKNYPQQSEQQQQQQHLGSASSSRGESLLLDAHKSELRFVDDHHLTGSSSSIDVAVRDDDDPCRTTEGPQSDAEEDDVLVALESAIMERSHISTSQPPPPPTRVVSLPPHVYSPRPDDASLPPPDATLCTPPRRQSPYAAMMVGSSTLHHEEGDRVLLPPSMDCSSIVVMSPIPQGHLPLPACGVDNRAGPPLDCDDADDADGASRADLLLQCAAAVHPLHCRTQRVVNNAKNNAAASCVVVDSTTKQRRRGPYSSETLAEIISTREKKEKCEKRRLRELGRRLAAASGIV